MFNAFLMPMAVPFSPNMFCPFWNSSALVNISLACWSISRIVSSLPSSWLLNASSPRFNDAMALAFSVLASRLSLTTTPIFV